jgi:hypothetical protein
MSDFDRESMAEFYRKCGELYRSLKLGPRNAAAALDASIEAQMIMPLFNAIAQKGGGPDLSFDLFTEVEPALERLGIPVEDGLKVAARTK